jgi:hypothetical protein
VRIPSPRLLAAATAGAVALSGAAGVAALTRDRGTTGLAAAGAAAPAGAQPGDAHSPGSAAAPATATPTATPTPSATQPPAATPSQGPRPRPEPSVPPETLSPAPAPTYLTDPHPVFGKVPPGTIQTKYVPGQRTWDVSGNGMHAVVTIPETIRTGSPMTWHVTVSGPGECCAVSMLYGDGYEHASCDAVPSATLTHDYNRAGRHAFEVQVQHDKCSIALLSFTGWFDVEPGPTTAQGPEPVQVSFSASGHRPAGHENDLHWVSLWAEAHDPDGYVAKFVVDYGDGSPLATFAWTGECARTADGWPAEQYSTLSDDPPPAHHYATGTYTLTITAYSTGCDGKSTPQTATASFEWDAGS